MSIPSLHLKRSWVLLLTLISSPGPLNSSGLTRGWRKIASAWSQPSAQQNPEEPCWQAQPRSTVCVDDLLSHEGFWGDPKYHPAKPHTREPRKVCAIWNHWVLFVTQHHWKWITDTTLFLISRINFFFPSDSNTSLKSSTNSQSLVFRPDSARIPCYPHSSLWGDYCSHRKVF